MIRIWIVLLAIIGYTLSQSSFCPPPWLRYQQSCYLLSQAQPKHYIDAIHSCEDHGASLVSVNTLDEHTFIKQQLVVYGTAGQLWYTSGIVNTPTDIKWEGDGTKTEILPRDQDLWWASEADRHINYSRIVYRTDNEPYGWTRASRFNEIAYICEILQAEASRISQDERDFTYGTNLTDPNFAARGPVFSIQPKNLVVVTDSRADDPDEAFSVSLECFAEGNPLPTYTVIHTMDDGKRIEISSATDGRYTLTGGRLVIHDPIEELDSGYYQWVAANPYGTAKSDMANITFGVLGQFSNVIRAPVVVQEYQSAIIQCSPPFFKPGINYQWYRDSNADFVRPDLNPHMFISNNGKLYFSEVSQTDESDYRCFVQLTGGVDNILSSEQVTSRVSLPIPLDVRESVPATWGPVIADGFIASFPNTPRRGFPVKLECLAYGTLPLTYSWSRAHYPMPEGTVLSDHNRVLQIPDVQLEDDGTYYCTVARTAGNSVTAAHRLVVETKPYFLLPLQHQHADIGSQLTWRCEAKAIPRATYAWYKDGVLLATTEDFTIHVQSNILVIKNLDPIKHNGTYQCAARNTHGQVYSAAQLRVLAFKPIFTKNPLDPSQSAAIGSSTTIECAPEAAPKPQYTWTRNGVSLNLPDVDDGVSRVRKLANGNLHISDVQSQDTGTYGCTATNAYGTDTSFGQLKVVSSTVITTPPQNTVTRVNHTAVMFCQASFPGSVDYAYVWKLNGWDINTRTHTHYRVGSQEYPGALYISMAQYKHTGVYMCLAQTAYMAVNATAYLRVQGPPGPPAGVRADPTTITSTSITLIWTRGQEHGRPVHYHNIETSTENNRTWVQHATNIPVIVSQILGTDKHMFNVEGLMPSNGYMFRLVAANELGVSVASRPSVVFRIPGAAPAKYPDNVGGGGGSVGTLTITWDPLPSQDQAGPGIGYTVYWRRKGTSTKYLQVVIEGNEGSFSVTVGQNSYYLEYEVKVAAFNDYGAGPVSSDGVYIFSAEDLAIGVATNVYAWPFNSTALYVSWQIVPDTRENMKGRLLGYQVNYQLRDVPDASLDGISWRGESDLGVVIGLDSYTWYTVDIQILNTAGMGPRSEVFHAKTYKAAPLLYPTEVNVYSRTYDTVTIKWRGVSTTVDEENLEGYKVRYWQALEDVRSAKDVVTERGVTEAVIPGVMRDIVYECRVLGYSRGGDGKHSESVFFTRGGRVALDPTSSEIMAGASRTSSNIITCIIASLTLIICHLIL